MGLPISAPDFISIDFETATQDMDSACAIGIAIVQGGHIVDTFYSLIQPPENFYDPHNIAIHGITPEDTADAPSFRDVWNSVKDLFGCCPVVAHNANFDMSVLAVCCKNSWITPDNFKYLDTMNLVKGIVEGSKSLSNCAAFLGIRQLHHHNALDDAVTCAQIALSCIEHYGEQSLIEFSFKTPHVLIHNFSELHPLESLQSSKRSHADSVRSRRFESVSPKEICRCTESVDSNHPLYGKNVVFTGELSIDRRTAMQMAADVGAVIKSSVSRKTDYLVVGEQDISLVGDDGMSTKEERAYELNSSGKANICIIREQEFFSLLGPLHGSSHDRQMETELGVL